MAPRYLPILATVAILSPGHVLAQDNLDRLLAGTTSTFSNTLTLVDPLAPQSKPHHFISSQSTDTRSTLRTSGRQELHTSLTGTETLADSFGNLIATELVGNGSWMSVFQEGKGNAVSVVSNGTGNSVTVTQLGFSNFAAVHQSGMNNSVEIAQQSW